MLINRFNHPFLHNAARMGTMNIDINTLCFILKSNTRARSRPFVMNLISEVRQKRNGFLVCEVLGLLLETFYQFFFCSHKVVFVGKGTKFSTNFQIFPQFFPPFRIVFKN